MQDNDEVVSRLLKLKRFEQPPPEYFENFLREFKDRQRAQLLREPAWRIAWDRLCAFFGEQMPSRLGYGLATACVLITAGIASFNIIESRPVEFVSAPVRNPAQTASLNLNTQVRMPDLTTLASGPAHTAILSTPRYVMDARPVSYEPPSSF